MPDVPGWCAEYVGKPFRLGGDGPEEYDCWGVVRLALRRRFGIDVPALTTLRGQESAAQIAEGATAWDLIERTDARPGDVIAFRGVRRGIHVGLLAGGPWMLHARRGATTCVDRYDRAPWQGCLLGFYRHRSSA